MNPVESEKRSKQIAYDVSGPSASEARDSSSAAGLSPSEEGSLEKVRDILFGAQSREFDQRVHALENRLLQESINLREELTRSLESLKVHFTHEVSQLKDLIQQEEKGRTSSLADVGQVIQTLGVNIEAQLSQLRQQATQQSDLLEQQIIRQKADLTEDHTQQMAELQEKFHEGLQLLKKEKTDRAALAEMLMDLALRLKVGPRDDSAS
ncbi:MAG: hypothetical protein OEY91_03515 [Nitrospirota bacterium]|nr:hypothetical protein [Nitrospirota bacterium]